MGLGSYPPTPKHHGPQHWEYLHILYHIVRMLHSNQGDSDATEGIDVRSPDPSKVNYAVGFHAPLGSVDGGDFMFTNQLMAFPMTVTAQFRKTSEKKKRQSMS